MRTHTKDTQQSLTPERAIEYLKEGNERFVNNLRKDHDLLKQINATSSGQFPFAAILSCIDSRTSAELIFDQGLGDVFSIRIAGNILNDDILGSMEFACKVAGSKLIVVLGHTNCGAITGACNNLQMGYITTLLDKIKPAMKLETETPAANRNAGNPVFLQNVTVNNVKITVNEVKKRSEILALLETEKKIKIIGALYDVETGVVKFYDV
jgi:carbonic anhydrase